MSERWTEEEIAEASKMWNDGYSASLIGDKLRRTKQMVVGIAHRHRDLFPGKKPGFCQPHDKRPKEPSVFSKPSRSKAVAKAPKPAKPSRWAQPAISAIDGRRSTKVAATIRPERTDPNFKPRKPVTIVDLNHSTCRWPLWGMDENPGVSGLYCGDATIEGCVYCSHHRLLGTGVGTESERRALKVLARAA